MYAGNGFIWCFWYRHGVRQVRNPWVDGPEYITQCPIQPGNKYTYRIEFTTEEGTIWWHAHSGWARATVHGAIFVYPKPGSSHPFSKPYAEFPIILGMYFGAFIRSLNYKCLNN